MNDIQKKEKKNLISILKTNKKFQYVFICVCLLIAIILVVNIFFTKKSAKELNSIDTYVENLENRLANTLSRVYGVGNVSVVITVESGMETVLANKITTTQTPQGTETEESPIIVNGKTVVIKESYPKIIGVLIVCEGAENIAVMSRIQQATISLLDININQIEILAM